MRSTIFYLSLLLAGSAWGQTRIEWEKSYGGSGLDQANAIWQTLDGGFIAAGYTESVDGDISGHHGGEDVWVVKVDATGSLQWAKAFGGSADERAEDIRQTADGGYILACHSQSADGDLSGNKGLRDYWILKLDADGNLQWQKNYGGSGSDAASAIRQTPDGGFIVAGNSQSVNGDISGPKGGLDYWILKLDAAGNIEWKRNYGGSDWDTATSIEVTAGGGYIVAGQSASVNGDVGGNNGSRDYWIVKLDDNGNILWQRNYGGSNTEQAEEIQQTADGGYVIGGYSYSGDGPVGKNNGDSDAWIVKLDASGNFQWGRVYGGFSYDEPYTIAQASDGGYIVGGLTRTPPGNCCIPMADASWILRLDPSGFLLWEKRFGGNGFEQTYSIRQTPDNGFIFTGVSEFPNGDVSSHKGILDVWIVKLAALPGSIQGHVYLDNNTNCIYESGDTTLPGIVLTAVNTVSGDTLYGYTNPLGEFLIEADTVPHLLSYTLPSPYFEAVGCSPNEQLVPLDSLNPNGSHDFFATAVTNCPYMTVDIGASLLRRCFSSSYTLSYCNQGTVTAEDAYVEVSFAPEITVTGSSIPWSAVNGNTYTFPLGDIAVLACDQFSVTVSIACDSTFIGQTLCAEAHIYPDTNCVSTANWNGAELKATVTCVGADSVQLKLQNIGNGNMLQAVPFLVIEDIIMRDGGQVQLVSQGSMTWTMPIDGLTQRLIAQQPSEHPFKTYTTAAVNLCNTEDLPPVPGPLQDHFTAYPDDEEAPYIAIDCQPIIGGFDPNDKTVHPAGASEQGFITAETELTYKIRFQNTGNDTAFTVVLIDTIAPQLDVATLRPGAASHPYVLDVSGPGILKFTFRDILLPDSNTNEPASHGFVQFSLRQKAGNPNGTVIDNQASIYFDYNPPVVTNLVFNTVGEIYVVEPVSTNDTDGAPVSVQVYPNPARDKMSFVLDNPAISGFDLLVFNIQGKLVHQINTSGNSATLFRNSLPEGLYFFKITSGGNALASGRVVFK